MTLPTLLALETAVPAARYAQQDVADYFIARQIDKTRRARAISTIFERSGVGFRHMVVDDQFFLQERTTQERNDLYMQEAVPLAETAVQRGLASAGYSPADVDELIVVSCTGFSIPGLDLHLAQRLGMRHDLQRTCILGMGCYGTFPGLLRAMQAVKSDPYRRALVVSVELCSLHMQFDPSAESVVSASLFSDGAGMALVGGADAVTDPAPRLLRSATYSDYTTLDHMSFCVTDHGFRMYLSSYVPDVLAANVQPFIQNLLGEHGLSAGDVRFWGIHPGSTRIVDYIQQQLGLADQQVEFSHQVLHDYGNMSSTTILFVLDQIQRCGRPARGDYGVLLAFGPGLTMEGLLMQW